jgi:hypothetical protein
MHFEDLINSSCKLMVKSKGYDNMQWLVGCISEFKKFGGVVFGACCSCEREERVGSCVVILEWGS